MLYRRSINESIATTWRASPCLIRFCNKNIIGPPCNRMSLIWSRVRPVLALFKCAMTTDLASHPNKHTMVLHSMEHGHTWILFLSFWIAGVPIGGH